MVDTTKRFDEIFGFSLYLNDKDHPLVYSAFHDDDPEKSLYLDQILNRALALLRGRSTSELETAKDTAYYLCDTQIVEVENQRESTAIDRKLDEFRHLLSESKRWPWKHGVPDEHQEQLYRQVRPLFAEEHDPSTDSVGYRFIGNRNDIEVEFVPVELTWFELLKLAAKDVELTADDDEGFPNAQEYEYFAVHALVKLGDAISGRKKKWTAPNYSYSYDEQGNRKLTGNSAHNFSVKIGSPEHIRRLELSTNWALEALDALCYAENLWQEHKLDRAVERAVHEQITLTAKLGGVGRSKAYQPVREKAHQLAKQYAPIGGIWPSRRQAVLAIKGDVLAFAEKTGAPRMSEQQADITIDNWLRRMPEVDTLFASKRGTSASRGATSTGTDSTSTGSQSIHE